MKLQLLCQDVKRIIAENNFGNTRVHASKLIWDENYTAPQEFGNKFDVIVASDCLFYVKSHKGLLHTIDKLLTSKGHVILMAPRRSGTLQQFCNTATSSFNVQVITDYDELVSKKVKEVHVCKGSRQ
ncbi:hypothetical protein QZH41_013435 [Actinostola sp. cb2023]|nr:hypothetical protein QZH41_013435 [Actinostola sp. cb2023]